MAGRTFGHAFVCFKQSMTKVRARKMPLLNAFSCSLGAGWRVAFVTFGNFGRQKLLTLCFFYPLLCFFWPFLTVFEKY
jgi:hypothetical protein